MKSLVDCYVIREDKCAIELGFKGPQASVSVSVSGAIDG